VRPKASGAGLICRALTNIFNARDFHTRAG